MYIFKSKQIYKTVFCRGSIYYIEIYVEVQTNIKEKK